MMGWPVFAPWRNTSRTKFGWPKFPNCQLKMSTQPAPHDGVAAPADIAPAAAKPSVRVVAAAAARASTFVLMVKM